MITQKEMKSHFLSLKNAVYVWGANGQKITEALMDALYKSYGTSKYNREYYKNKLIEGLGRIGADCSGAFKKSVDMIQQLQAIITVQKERKNHIPSKRQDLHGL